MGYSFLEEDREGPAAVAAAKLLQSCLTLCDPIDGSPRGICEEPRGFWPQRETVPGELGVTRVSLCGLWECACLLSHFSCVPLFVTITHQAPLSMELSRQEYWSGLLYPRSGSFHYPGIEPEPPEAPALQADSLP